MTVTLNYTNLQKLSSENFKVSIDAEGSVPLLTLEAIDLSEYEFPADSPVVIEVLKRNNKLRMDAGTVAHPRPLVKERLEMFSIDESFNVRARVISNDQASPGLLLGFADHIKVPRSLDEQPSRGFLRLRKRDIGSILWRFSIDDDEPILEVNKTFPDLDWILRSPFFSALVLPEFIRRVAEWLYREVASGTSNLHINTWLEFFSLQGCDVDILDALAEHQNPDPDEMEDWADRCSQRFSKSAKLLAVLGSRIADEEGI